MSVCVSSINVKAHEAGKGCSRKTEQQDTSRFQVKGLCALLLNAIIQINFQPQATECKYTFIYMGNMG